MKKGNQWGSFLKFYTRFPISWGLYILSALLGLVYAELSLTIAGYLIRVNQGELYNGVILGYVLLNLLNALIGAFQNIAGGYGNERVTWRARKVLWKKILHLPLSQVERQQPSNLISCVTNDVVQASQCMTMLFLAFSSVYGFVRTMAMMLNYNARLSLWLLLAVPVAILTFYLVGRIQFTILKRQFEALNVMTGHFSQHLSGMKHVKTQNIEEMEYLTGCQAIDARYRADVYYAFMSAVQVLLNSVYTNLTTIIIALGGSGHIRRGQMERSGINVFSTYMDQVNKYLAELLTHYQTVKGTQGSLSHVNEVLALPEEELSGKGCKPEPEKSCKPEPGKSCRPEPEKSCKPGQDRRSGAQAEAQVLQDGRELAGDIVFEEVHFSFDGQQEILKGVSFRIPFGKRTAVIGDNGSGKSTVLKLIQGLYPLNGGRIRMNGYELADLPLWLLRAQFGYVLQSAPLFSGTVYDNIIYGMEQEPGRERAEAAARLADAHEFILGLPQGYDTQVGENGCYLSGGQRQRIAIARAFIRHNSFLLLDEAVSSLDYQSAARVMGEGLSGAAADTVVYITHNIEEIAAADHVIVLSRGLVEAEGTPEELSVHSETYRSYQASQKRGEAAL